MNPGGEWLVERGEWTTLAEQRAAARRLLGRLTGHDARVEHDADGAPYLPDNPELHISLSHCRRAVAVAVSRTGRIGIDVESRRKVSPSLMERVCTPDERAAIKASDDPTMAFLRCWTRKEAVLKMRGTGIKGFESMVAATEATDCKVETLDCGLDDVVAAVATAL